MKRSKLVLIVGVMCFLTGCPYKSDQPAEKSPAGGIAPAALGIWESCQIDEKQECLRLFVYQFNEAEYYVEAREVTNTEDRISIETSRYQAFSTGIGSPALINLRSLSLSTSAVSDNLFIRVDLPSSDSLNVSFVSDNFAKEKFKSSNELGEYLKMNLDKPGFLEPFTTFKRIKLPN